MNTIAKLTELKKLMMSMELALGLDDLSKIERDVYCAACELTDESGRVKTMAMLEHTFILDVSRPTFFRALKSLVKKGLLSNNRETVRGWYYVNETTDKTD
jgi:predicted transcriptional regulator